MHLPVRHNRVLLLRSEVSARTSGSAVQEAPVTWTLLRMCRAATAAPEAPLPLSLPHCSASCV
jgi:hypothetical protein